MGRRKDILKLPVPFFVQEIIKLPKLLLIKKYLMKKPSATEQTLPTGKDRIKPYSYYALTYLSHVLHDEAVLAYALHGAYAPAAAIVRAEDAERVADAALHHAVEAVGPAAAALVALVDGHAGPQAHLALLVVGEAVLRGAGAAAVHRLAVAVRALAAQRHLRQRDAVAHLVVVDVGEAARRAHQVHVVLHGDAAAAALQVERGELALPAL